MGPGVCSYRAKGDSRRGGVGAGRCDLPRGDDREERLTGAALWDVAAGSRTRLITGHTEAVYDLVFSPDGTLLVTPLLNPLIAIPMAGYSQLISLANNPGACGISLYFQVLELDGGASSGVSFTPGLQANLGGSQAEL